ncbi:helix-turn-helix domain-containing protein [Leptolyngbya sp. AN02str]|uniref:helix-turn-helix domain-containing protein n=1 Tax=Leptolyngbya sp. AN02str TaxID=3423363 RepID=UPI003D31D5C4
MRKDEGFVSRLKLLIAQFGSARAFARECSVSESAIRKWKDGISEPTRDKLIAMADAAGVSVEWLATGQSHREGNSIQQKPTEKLLYQLNQLLEIPNPTLEQTEMIHHLSKALRALRSADID